MQAMAPPRPTALQHRRIRLAADPRAVAEARKQLRVTLATWDVPVDAETAELLTSELVTNAVTHDGDGAIVMSVRVARGRLRVDVHDCSATMPEARTDAPLDAEDGRGLLLVDMLSAEWGFYRTPGGKAVYFALSLRE